MKKIISILTIFCVLIMHTMGVCRAEGTNQKITTLGYMQFPLHYLEEPKQTYRIMQYENKTTYLLSRVYNLLGNEYNPIQLCNNEQFIKILESGYPNVDLDDLGLTNWEEAYAATQEVIYAVLDGKNLDLYEQESALGGDIISAMKKIANGIDKKDIVLKEQNSGWLEYTLDSNYCYKEYKVLMKSRAKQARISLLGIEESKITDKAGNEISEVTNNQTIKIVIPKGSNKNFHIQIDYIMEVPKIYQMTDNLKKGYLIVDFYNQDRQYQLEVKPQRYVNVTITNYNEKTNLPIKSNKFQIIDESNNIYLDNLETNEEGKINFYLQKGNYYLKQIETKEGILQKELLPITVIGDEKNIELNVYNSILKQEEIVENQKEINITQEEKIITQNNIKDIINICTTNVRKDIINQTNQTNLHKVNNFINTINRKTIKNLKQNDTYENEVFEDDIIIDEILPGKVLNTPILPVALRQ